MESREVKLPDGDAGGAEQRGPLAQMRTIASDAVVEGATCREEEERYSLRLFLAFLTVAAVMIATVSYIDEDAFISFRTVENFVSGYGLRWNVDERVQAFTNPLWVLLIILIRVLLGDVVIASYLTSIVCSTAAIGVVAWPLRQRPLLFGLGLFLPLFLSRAFTDYTNSGFENPLTFLLVGLFTVRFLRMWEPIPWLSLTLWTALLAVNRLDAVLLTAPAMLWLYLTNYKQTRYRAILGGALPLVGWLAFSVFYYGMPFPNTKYAKLDAGVATAAYWKFGWAYVLDILRNDPVTFAGLLGGFVVTGAAASRWWRTRDPVWGRIGGLGFGVVIASAYVVWIGGDFMAGRHWSSPFFLAVVVIVYALRERGLVRQPVLLPYACAALGLKVAVEPLLMERDTIRMRERDPPVPPVIIRNRGIHDQRFNCSFYEALLGTRGAVVEHPWSQQGLRYQQQAEEQRATAPDERFVIVRGIAGKMPFHAGPDVVVVDMLALTDPLLARLPDEDGHMSLIGHLDRHVPTGYVEARRTGSLELMDPALQDYYRELRHITAGPLFEWERLATILRFHLGVYDEHLDAYLEGAYQDEVKRARRDKRRQKRARDREADEEHDPIER